MSFVSVVIPCRDEEFFISRCLDSLLSQDFLKENLEIFVVDGMSKDKTRNIVLEYTRKYSFIKLLDNKNKAAPFGMNIGIKNSKGDIIILMGAHAIYDKRYISKCVDYLNKYNVDNVGGVTIPLSKDEGIIAKAIARAVASPFGAANAHYIIGGGKPREVDTVFGGCYKREVFNKIGLFNERLTRSQDMELNLRLKKAGGKIMFFPDIKAHYYPRRTELKDFFRYNFKNGIWAVYPIRIVGVTLKLRHYIPLFFVLALLVLGIGGIFNRSIFWAFVLLAFLYFLANLYFSLRIFFREKDVKLLIFVPLVFIVRHIGYGLGSIWGFLTIWKLKVEASGLTK
ncbi:hypothetical protein AMJ47_00240 [Parcubacteria bacterium DG_72]|nr:MAG: hypothetical protein AMJ47_00240 [Parcubacteria bacterium DG_72]